MSSLLIFLFSKAAYLYVHFLIMQSIFDIIDVDITILL